MPWNSEPLSSDPQEPAERKHHESHAASTGVEDDFLDLGQALACCIVDIILN
jgi:hypothetical protein